MHSWDRCHTICKVVGFQDLGIWHEKTQGTRIFPLHSWLYSFMDFLLIGTFDQILSILSSVSLLCFCLFQKVDSFYQIVLRRANLTTALKWCRLKSQNIWPLGTSSNSGSLSNRLSTYPRNTLTSFVNSSRGHVFFLFLFFQS